MDGQAGLNVSQLSELDIIFLVTETLPSNYESGLWRQKNTLADF